MMLDQIYDRDYQAARAHLNEGLVQALSRAAKAGFDAFQVLNRIEYGAPWLCEQCKSVRN